MTLQNNNCQTLTLVSTTLDAYRADPSPFTKIEFKGTYNNIDKTATITSGIADCNSTGAEIRTCSNIIYAYPELFNQTGSLADGVYKVEIKAFYDDDSITTEFACVFVDCETKCKVLEAQCIEATLWHYILTQSYSCNCSCDKLQDIWDALQVKLSNGCKEC